MIENQVAKALHDGLDRLRQRGLTKGTLCDRASGSVCIRGALIDEPNYGNWTPDYLDADRILDAVIKEQFPDRAGDWADPVVDFNDDDDTTQEDVERVFEKAIVKAYEMVTP